MGKVCTSTGFFSIKLISDTKNNYPIIWRKPFVAVFGGFVHRGMGHKLPGDSSPSTGWRLFYWCTMYWELKCTAKCTDKSLFFEDVLSAGFCRICSDFDFWLDLVGLGRIWSDSVWIGWIRSDSIGVGLIRSDLVRLDRTWSDSVRLGRIRSDFVDSVGLRRFGRIRLDLVRFGQILLDLVGFWSLVNLLK